jgi:hypothetical protein
MLWVFKSDWDFSAPVIGQAPSACEQVNIAAKGLRIKTVIIGFRKPYDWMGITPYFIL